MKGSITIGKIKGIQLEINLSWFVVFALVVFTLATGYFPQNYPAWDPGLTWILSGIIALLLFISVLLHELAHSLVSVSLGINVKKISLFIFGGIAEIEKEPDVPAKELKIAVAGPATSILLFILFTILANTTVFLGGSEALTVLLAYVGQREPGPGDLQSGSCFPLTEAGFKGKIIGTWTGNLHKATKIASSLGSFSAIS